MSVSINLIKELRELTHAPLGDCKKALEEANGEITKAQEILKEKGILKAGKKSDRETNNGIVKFAILGSDVVCIKVLCETDFVAKNQMFLDLVDSILEKAATFPGYFSHEEVSQDHLAVLQAMLDAQVATVGEKLQLSYLMKQKGPAYAYNHMGNTIASCVWYTGGNEETAKLLALQVAAMNPTYIQMSQIPNDVLQSKKEEFIVEMSDSGKPADIIEKIVDGKVQKHFQEDVLFEQASIKDPTKRIKDILGDMQVQLIMRETVG